MDTDTMTLTEFTEPIGEAVTSNLPEGAVEFAWSAVVVMVCADGSRRIQYANGGALKHLDGVEFPTSCPDQT
jgi:hypothetical protein